MKALVFQHTEQDSPGTLLDWLRVRRIQNQIHHWYRDDRSPDSAEHNWLILLGGPMSVDNEDKFPWMKEEKRFIKEWLSEGRPVLGICLGSQLLAQALGGKVSKNPEREIGFNEITRTGTKHPCTRRWPDKMRVYQYHEDTFSLPPGCSNLLTSPGCTNQAFALDKRTVGIQFHPESTSAWIRYNAPAVQQKQGEPYVQNPAETNAELPRSLVPMTTSFFRFLDDFVEGMN